MELVLYLPPHSCTRMHVHFQYFSADIMQSHCSVCILDLAFHGNIGTRHLQAIRPHCHCRGSASLTINLFCFRHLSTRLQAETDRLKETKQSSLMGIKQSHASAGKAESERKVLATAAVCNVSASASQDIHAPATRNVISEAREAS